MVLETFEGGLAVFGQYLKVVREGYTTGKSSRMDVNVYGHPHLCGKDYWSVLAGTGRYWWVRVGTGA